MTKGFSSFDRFGTRRRGLSKHGVFSIVLIACLVTSLFAIPYRCSQSTVEGVTVKRL